MIVSNKTTIYPIHFILLLGCLGFSSMLYGTQENSPLDDEKESIEDSTTPPRHLSAHHTGDHVLKEWTCTSMRACKALQHAIEVLKHWQKLKETGNPKSICDYLHKDNHYRSIVGVYHHLLDVHLSGKTKKDQYDYIHKQVAQAFYCNPIICTSYKRHQRQKGKAEEANKQTALWQCPACALKNYPSQTHCQACFRPNDGYTPPLPKLKIDPGYIFLAGFLDNMHAYLVHGYDSGHRYLESAAPTAISGNRRRRAVSSSPIDGFEDRRVKTLQKSQQNAKTQPWNIARGPKFQIALPQWKQATDDPQQLSLNLLETVFGDDQAFIAWRAYLANNDCDTDNIREEIALVDPKEAVIPMDKALCKKVKVYTQRLEASITRSSSPLYGFGVPFCYWFPYKYSQKANDYIPAYQQKDFFVAPIYTSLKEELLAKGVSLDRWHEVIFEASRLLALSPTLKKLTTTDRYGRLGALAEMYGFDESDPISVDHIVSLLFYTNFTALATQFRRSFRWLSDLESLQDLKKRNATWAHLSKYVRETVEVFGHTIYEVRYPKNPVEAVPPPKFYCGADYGLCSQFSLHFYAPLSTSRQLEVATLYTKKDGVILSLAQIGQEEENSLRFFNASLLSYCASENECLFMGGQFPLQISGIRLVKEGVNIRQIVHALSIIGKIISGKSMYEDKVLGSDIPIFKRLVSAPATLPSYAQHIWERFRHQQQRIHIDLSLFYRDYRLFSTCFIHPKLNSCVLFDRILAIFPNVTSIVCEKVDCLRPTGYTKVLLEDPAPGSTYVAPEHTITLPSSFLPLEYVDHIVDETFIADLKDTLSKVKMNQVGKKLQKIVLQTDQHPVSKTLNLHTKAFARLGWQIALGSNTEWEENSALVLTKARGDFLTKMAFVLRGEQFQCCGSLNASDVLTFKQLVAGKDGLPCCSQESWQAFAAQQKSIHTRMSLLYGEHALFKPVLFSTSVKNLLLFDQVAKIFPNVTEIKCSNIDYTGKNDADKDTSRIVNPAFIKGLQDIVANIRKHAKLKRIVIKTRGAELGVDLSEKAFNQLGWQIGKGKGLIVLKKQPPNTICPFEDVRDIISAMIHGQTPPYPITSLDMPICTALISGDKDVPPDAKKLWDTFRYQPQKIAIDLSAIHTHYEALMPLLFAPKCQNLCLFDKIVQIFPNAKRIICISTNYKKVYIPCYMCRTDVGKKIPHTCSPTWRGDYVADIVDTRFIATLKNTMHTIASKHPASKLEKISIRTSDHPIEAIDQLLVAQFGALGWQIERNIYMDEYGNANKHCQLTLTKQ